MSEQQELFPRSLTDVLINEQKLTIEKQLVLEKALRSDDPNAIYQAQSYLNQIEKRQVVDSKSLLVDPMDLTSSFGYKDKPFNLSYEVLRGMGRTPIVKAIIETRKEQVCEYCKPQPDKFSPGFSITKKQKYSEIEKDVKLTKAEEKRIEWLIEFLLGCGTTQNFWHSDTLDNFMSKLVQDSLTFDQGCFEIVRNRKGEPVEFFATDGGTYRIADTYNDDPENTKYPEKIIQGYAPSYVQLYQSKVVSEFYPWELCFGVRNPQSDIRYNGYGRAELEDMIATVTALLNADTYNANFFKVGSAPKGILRYSGNVNENTLQDFRRQWIAQVSGVLNAHKIPMLNADKMEFINTMTPNKDMEYSKYQDFLIKVACALYKIDPSEIGFTMNANSSGNGGSSMKGDETKEKIEYSKDKGLKPLLKKIEYWINKYLIWQLDPEYEFRFGGIDDDDEESDLERDVTMLANFMTLNEIRAKRNLPPIEGGDVPLSPVFMQVQQMEAQKEQMEAQQDHEKDMQESDYQNEEDAKPEEDEDPFGADPKASGSGATSKGEENIFMKSLAADIEQLLCEND